MIDALNKYLNTVYGKTPQWALGSKEAWKIKFFSQFGALGLLEEAEARVRFEQKQLLLRYIAVILAGALLMTLGFCGADRSELPESIKRPSYGEAGYTLPLEAEVRWPTGSMRKTITLSVEPKSLSQGEKESWLLNLARELPEKIKGENADLSHVHRPLQLIEKDMETGILLRWFSDCPERVDTSGNVDLVGIECAESVNLKAELQLGGLRQTVLVPVTLVPAEEAAEYQTGILRRLEEAVGAAEGEEGELLHLPKELKNKISVQFSRRKETTGGAIPVLCLAACFGLYQCRYRGIENESRNRMEAMRREFPELVNQVVLLLNAGLVVTAALLEAAESVPEEKNQRERPLFHELFRIAQRVRQSNASFTKELMEFAQASGFRELVRFSSIVEDNIDKGSDLAEKLELEGELLRDQQKRVAEERCRTAETKLTLPLMSLLLVLIMIAIAPVMFQM